MPHSRAKCVLSPRYPTLETQGQARTRWASIAGQAAQGLRALFTRSSAEPAASGDPLEPPTFRPRGPGGSAHANGPQSAQALPTLDHVFAGGPLDGEVHRRQDGASMYVEVGRHRYVLAEVRDPIARYVYDGLVEDGVHVDPWVSAPAPLAVWDARRPEPRRTEAG